MTPGLTGPPPLLIGWKEYVAFPEWDLRRVRAKIDTGACTSALDVAGYELEAERRPVVEAMVRLGPVEKRIRLTVTRRSTMRFRMLLGREALRGQFVVDVRRKYVFSV